MVWVFISLLSQQACSSPSISLQGPLTIPAKDPNEPQVERRRPQWLSACKILTHKLLASSPVLLCIPK